MSEDPLQYVPSERWSELQKVFKTDWPRGIFGYCALDTQKHFIEKGVGYVFKVYCPFGDVLNGMVTINEQERYEIVVQCPRDDTRKLEDALTRTSVIDWKRWITIPYAPYHVIECLQKVCANKNLQLELLYCETFILDKPKIFEDVSLPPNVTFGLLSSEHVELVDSSWPHRYKNSILYFQLLIDMKSGYGLFRDNNLIAWIIFNECGTFRNLYTVENERRKGYGELLMKLVSNVMIKENKPVFVCCVKDNIKGCQLYTKLGFVKTEPVAYCYVNKHLE